MQGIIAKIFVTRYYSINAGLFLFFFLLFFGVVDAQGTVYFHYSIMQGAAHSLQVMGILAGVWLLYAAKCISFMTKAISDPVNSFLRELQALSSGRQYRFFFTALFLLFLPVVIYAAITAGVAAHEGNALAVAAIAILVLGVLHLSAVLCRQQLRYHEERWWEQYLPAFATGRRQRSLNFVLINLSLAKHKKTLVVLKLASMLLLQALVAYNREKLSKESVCFFMMLIIAAHAMLPYYHVRYTEQQMAWLRNMPLSAARRFGIYATAYAILFVPELSFLLLHVHYAIPVATIVSLYLLGVAQLAFFTSILYLPGMKEERYMLWVLVTFIVSMILLAGVHIGVYALALMSVAFLLFILRYERYELFNDNER